MRMLKWMGSALIVIWLVVWLVLQVVAVAAIHLLLLVGLLLLAIAYSRARWSKVGKETVS